MKKRAGGILLHITSLPSVFGIGDLGPGARRFVDFLAAAGQGYWQILPLNPTDPGGLHSPYHSASALAGNPLLISPEALVEDGLLEPMDLKRTEAFPEDRVDYDAAAVFKEDLFRKAHARFMAGGGSADYDRFLKESADWLDDFVRFTALGERMGRIGWDQWPAPYRDHDERALAEMDLDPTPVMERARFLQYLFQRQWMALRDYANRRGVQIIGDIPIYVKFDSVDVWANRELFKLDATRRPYAVSGVPPDYFSSTGQLWGHPVYNWPVIRERDFKWWKQRLARNLALFDWARLDHFRGLVSYWEVPAGETTAINGRWVDAPTLHLFNSLASRFSSLPILAEDLGIIGPDVREVMRRFGFPGMRLLLFAFGDELPIHPYAPHNHVEECVAYTGTHDNNTVRGWFDSEASEADKERFFAYIGRRVGADAVAWEMIRLAMMSPARLAILPMQDVLGLGREARMNRPATTSGNWLWRLRPEGMSREVAERLGEMTRLYGRI